MNLFSNQFQHISLSLNIAETILIIVRMELKKIRERKKQKERTKKKKRETLDVCKIEFAKRQEGGTMRPLPVQRRTWKEGGRREVARRETLKVLETGAVSRREIRSCAHDRPLQRPAARLAQIGGWLVVHVKLGVFTPGESGTEADCFDSLEWARSLHAPTFSINPYQRYDSVYAGISPFFRLCASVFSKSSNIFFPPLPFFLFEIFQREFWHVVHVRNCLGVGRRGKCWSRLLCWKVVFVVWKVIKGDDGLFLVGGGRRNQGRVCKGDCSWRLAMKWGSILIEIVLMGNIYIQGGRESCLFEARGN